MALWVLSNVACECGEAFRIGIPDQLEDFVRPLVERGIPVDADSR